MKKRIERILGASVSAVLLVSSFGGAYAFADDYTEAGVIDISSENNILVQDGFDDYNYNETSIQNGDVVPGALSIAPSMDVGTRKLFYDATENQVKIIPDETGNNKGNVLKLVSDNNSVFPIVKYTKPMGNSTGANASRPHDEGKKLVVKMNMFFDRDTAFGYKLTEDGRTKYYNEVEGKDFTWPCLTQAQLGFVSINGTISSQRRSDVIATLSFDNTKAAEWNDNSYIPAYINTRQGSDDSANSMKVQTGTAKLPTDKWFEVSFVFHTDKINEAEDLIPMSAYIDGKVCVEQSVKLGGLANFKKSYMGLSFAPLAFYDADVAGAKGECKPIMYVDDMEIGYVSEYIPKISFVSGDISSTDTSAVKTDSKIVVEFESDIDDVSKEALTAAGAVTLTDNKGETLALKSITVDKNKLIAEPSENMWYNREYTLSVPVVAMYNNYHIKFEGHDYKFTTQKSKGAYIVSKTVTTGSTNTIAVTTSEDTTVIAASFKDSAFAAAGSAATSGKSATITLSGAADYFKLILADSEGKSIYDAVIVPESTVITEPDKKDSSQLTFGVVDAAKSVIEFIGNTGVLGNNQYGRIEIYNEKKEKLSDYDKTKAEYISDFTIDAKGRYTDTFSFNGKAKGTYYIWTVTDKAIVCTEYEFVSAADVASAIKNVAITDKTDEDYVPANKLYEEMEKMGAGLGVDFDTFYSTDRDKKLFEHRVDLNRNLLTGTTDAELIEQFKTLEADINKEIEFLRDLENPMQKNEIEYLLKNNTDITGMDFTKYSSIPDAAYDAFIGKTFNNADEIENFFEDALDDANKPSTDNKPKPPGGGGGGGGFSGRPMVVEPDESKINENAGKNEFKEAPFGDIADFEWAIPSINSLYNKKILNGDENGNFNPDKAVTREEFVKMLVLACGMYSEKAECSFTDINKTDWCYKFVASAVEGEIITGVDENTFGAGLNVTRQDMATMIYRIIADEHELTEDEKTEILTSEESFDDMDKAADYAIYAIEYLRKEKLVTGKNDNCFDPSGNMTRAEAAVIVDRLIEYGVK